MNCSRDFALCILFGMEFTPANVIKANSKLESYGDLEVCYDSSGRNPILVPKNRINYDPYTYKRYLSTPPPKTIETKNNILLTSDSHLSQFVNAIFSHLNLDNNENYELKSVGVKDICKIMNVYTDKFETKTQFTQWTKNKINYTQVPFSRKRKSGVSARKRNIYILKPEFHEAIAKNITSRLANYQQHLQNLKKDFILIGYVRKSSGYASYRDKNIQKMVDNIYSRCKVDKCYVSYSSEAHSSIDSRDVKDDVETLAKLKNVHGNTQDMINVISSSKQKICLVVIDYSGLCTNHANIFQFVSDNKSIEKIIVDCFPFDCDAIEYNRRQILEDIDVLLPFNCRQSPRQRPKE